MPPSRENKEKNKARLQQICAERGGAWLSAEYIHTNIKCIFECRFGHRWSTKIKQILRGHWCPLCQHEASRQQNTIYKTPEERQAATRSSWRKNSKKESSRQKRKNRYDALSPEEKEARQRKSKCRKYGITLQEYDDLLLRQGGVCTLCGAKNLRAGDKYLCVDHDHITGDVRGLLCHRCNSGIGFLNDDPELLSKAAAYIRSHR